MNLTISKDDLLRMIVKLKGIPSRTSNMPILTHLHLMTEADNLFVTATDLELVLKIKGKAQVFEEGGIAVPADPLFRIIKRMPDEVVSLEDAGNHRIKISSGSAKFELFGLSADEFPTFPNMSCDRQFPFSGRALAAMIEKTMFAALRKDTIGALGGVFFEVTGENGKSMVSMVATDGHRLAKVETRSLNGIPKLSKGILIPLKGCVELLRMARETEGDLELGIGDSSLFVGKENESLIIRLLSGAFPDYRTITVGVTGKVVSSERRPLEECLERTLVMADGAVRQVRLRLQERDKLVVNAKSQSLGEAEDSLAIRSELEEISVCFNPDYLLEGLRVMKSREVEILLKDPESPAFITGKEDEGFSYLVMPMRG